MRSLVVYYSLTGNTEKVAQAIAKELGADLEAIREVRERKGGWGYFTAAMGAVFGAMPDLQAGTKDPGKYDIVVLGCPVWAQNPATPMHSWIARERSRLKRIACFCTLGGAGAENAFRKIARYSGISPVATMSADEPALKSGEWDKKVKAFAEAIAKTPTPS